MANLFGYFLNLDQILEWMIWDSFSLQIVLAYSDDLNNL